jgi:hypothetical protein
MKEKLSDQPASPELTTRNVTNHKEISNTKNDQRDKSADFGGFAFPFSSWSFFVNCEL